MNRNEYGVPVYSYFKEPSFWEKVRFYVIAVIIASVIAAAVLLVSIPKASAADLWRITSYCACVRCCGKTDGITASGKKAKYGMVACNWLPFGTKVKIEGLGVFSVQDRGARSLFGSKNNHIKHLDVYMNSHEEAKRFGVKYCEVEVI